MLVTSGKQTKLWEGSWLGKCTLIIIFHELYDICSKLDMSVEKVLEGGKVNLTFRRFFRQTRCCLTGGARSCLDTMSWNKYLESASHFIIRLLSNSSQFLGTKHGLREIGRSSIASWQRLSEMGIREVWKVFNEIIVQRIELWKGWLMYRWWKYGKAERLLTSRSFSRWWLMIGFNQQANLRRKNGKEGFIASYVEKRKLQTIFFSPTLLQFLPRRFLWLFFNCVSIVWSDFFSIFA